MVVNVPCTRQHSFPISMSTYVCYHLPGDRDEPDHPNAYPLAKQADEVTLRDIKESFPLPGDYHFRFKVKLDSGYYWLDCSDDSASVPVFSPRRIVAKVLRLSWKSGSIGQDSRLPSRQSSVAPPARVTTSAPVTMDLFGGSSPVRATVKQSASQPNNSSKVSDLDLFS